MYGVADRLLQRLQLLTRLETNRFARRNGHFGAGARIAADPGLARTHVEDSEASQFDAFAAPRARFMLSNTVSTAISALVLVMPVRLTTSLMMSSLIKAGLPVSPPTVPQTS